MKSGFTIDNPFFEWMGRLADLVVVNLLFFICSVPIVTMGASILAMYETIRKMRHGQPTSVAAYFFQAFRGALKKSIPAWAVQLITGTVLLFDITVAAPMPKTMLFHMIGIAVGSMLLLWAMITCYLLPAAVYDGKRLGEALSKSLYLSVRNLPYTAAMAALRSIPFVCMMLGTYFIGMATPIYMTAGFAATAYVDTVLLERCRELPVGKNL